MIITLIILLNLVFPNSNNEKTGCEIMSNKIANDFITARQTHDRGLIKLKAIKGNPKTIEQFRFSKKNELKSYEKQFYTIDNKLVKRISRIDNRPETIYEYKYDSLGNKTSLHRGNTSTYWIYGEDKYLIKRINGDYTSIYDYSLNKKIEYTLKNETDTTEIIISEYDDKKRLIKQTTTRFNKYVKTTKKMLSEYEYTAEGFDSTYQFSYLYPNNEKLTTSKYEYHYNECNQLEMFIDKKPYFSNDTTFYDYSLSIQDSISSALTISTSKSISEKYTFDNNGNWIEYLRYKNGELDKKQTRIFEYY